MIWPRAGRLRDGKGGRHVTDREALVALWVQAYVEGLRPKLKERRFQVRAVEKQEIWTRLETPQRQICSPTPSCEIGVRGKRSKPPNCSCPEFLTMPRIEPGRLPAMRDPERGLRELGVRFGLVGRQAVTAILDRFDEPDAVVVGMAAGEKGMAVRR